MFSKRLRNEEMINNQLSIKVAADGAFYRGIPGQARHDGRKHRYDDRKQMSHSMPPFDIALKLLFYNTINDQRLTINE
jgi:hypothetical protein